MNYLGMIIAFICGTLICFINYKLSKFVLLKSTKNLWFIYIYRQVINIGYLVLCYFISPYTNFERVDVLIGAATGITIPMIYFTPKLLKLSDKSNEITSKEEF